MGISVLPCRAGGKWIVLALDEKGRLLANSLPSEDLEQSLARVLRSLQHRGMGDYRIADADRRAESIANSIIRGESVEIATDGMSPLEISALRRVMGIPKGMVASYRDIALQLGNPGLARFVGNVMSKNPFPIVVPCHRVIRSDMSLGGFGYGELEKRRLLEVEGVEIKGGKVRERHRLARGR
ncbi:MAG: methylated-DNA--[protein]-cysteine S-methyltransferase [Candidatus Methanosuratincola sp.]|nr:methylated-DNA--[protein]-cysteine S-methyltransferase [Candidatus Methanosuratincola sp.]